MSGRALGDLKVGDRVQVFDINGSRSGEPKGGWDGKVVKVGRKLVTVEYGHRYTKVFRLDDGRANDEYGHQHIRTPEQAAEESRRADVVERLRVAGLELRTPRRAPLSTQTLESLAAVLDRVEGGE